MATYAEVAALVLDEWEAQDKGYAAGVGTAPDGDAIAEVFAERYSLGSFDLYMACVGERQRRDNA